jgi:hypothetical protein
MHHPKPAQTEDDGCGQNFEEISETGFCNFEYHEWMKFLVFE